MRKRKVPEPNLKTYLRTLDKNDPEEAVIMRLVKGVLKINKVTLPEFKVKVDGKATARAIKQQMRRLAG